MIPTNPELNQRRNRAKEIREAATQLAFNSNNPPVEHKNNLDESFHKKLMSFTKGLKHNKVTGLIDDENDFKAFSKAIDTGKPDDYKNTPLRPDSDGWQSDLAKDNNVKLRAWESGSAGLAFDLQGPDAWAVTMPPAPSIVDDEDELTGEIAEVYAQALLRDVPFHLFYSKYRSNLVRRDRNKVNEALDALNKLKYFKQKKRNGSLLSSDNVFRGFTEGDLIGPYISQFLLMGNAGLDTNGDNSREFDPEDGFIRYGSITIDQRVRTAKENQNYMTRWDEYIDVQNGADFGGFEEYKRNNRRFITTGRDLATYVHYDALYEAYLNACLILLNANSISTLPEEKGNLFDPGVPFQAKDNIDHQQGFALYGGPHILTLVTEVATRALKAVRFQKFNVHKRLRPEALAARYEKLNEIINDIGANPVQNNNQLRESLRSSSNSLKDCGLFEMLRDENEGNLLLPMAFAEGSPMHPSYGAGHATVAGACVTILKAFFNEEKYINISEDGGELNLTDVPGQFAFIPSLNGKRLNTIKSKGLKVGNELNKLAANISIGRNWAGVHYYTDYTESMKMGEEIAIGMLQEQSITYTSDENFSLSLTRFNGKRIKISNGNVDEI